MATRADELAWTSTLIAVAIIRNMGDPLFSSTPGAPSVPVAALSASMLELIVESLADQFGRWAPVVQEQVEGAPSVPVVTIASMFLEMIANALVDQATNSIPPDAKELVERRIRAIVALAQETVRPDVTAGGSGRQQAGQAKPGVQRQVVHTWDGAVEVGTNRVEVKKDQTITVAGLGGIPVFLREPPSGMLNSKAPRPDRVKVDPSMFDRDAKEVRTGLYVWVRDGEVSLARGGKTVDVSAGSAAVATEDRIELLDTVPNFLRFDSTPRPSRSPGDAAVDTFRAPDGSVFGMCTVR